jgi:hypothetical protein
MKREYRVALKKAQSDLDNLAIKEKEIAVRKAQLKETIDALNALCSDLPDINDLSLSDAIRLMIRGSHGGISRVGIRDRLQEMGYDLNNFKNPMASIHTACDRMLESGEFVKVDSDEKKIEPGPELKPIPQDMQAFVELTGFKAWPLAEEAAEEETD